MAEVKKLECIIAPFEDVPDGAYGLRRAAPAPAPAQPMSTTTPLTDLQVVPYTGGARQSEMVPYIGAQQSQTVPQRYSSHNDFT